MSARTNYIGRKFGRGTVIAEIEPYISPKGAKHRQGVLQCSCGKEYKASFCVLVSGRVISCGCFQLERVTTHGHCKNHECSRTYLAWQSMKSRCTDPNNKHFHNYGGRGISVCEHWQQFENFIADMGECPPSLEIDRIDNNGNYEPGNCRWATEAQQHRNQRSNRVFTVRGMTACLSDLVKHFGIVSRQSVCERLSKGWEPERAFTQPSHQGSSSPLPF